MSLSRRTFLQATAVPLVTSGLPSIAAAQAEVPPIIFVHGNGDHAALWMTQLWRFESNGVPTERLVAFNFTDPLARAVDTELQAGRSSTEDQLRELTEQIDALRRATGQRVALVGSSRGGNSIRNYVANGGAANVSHVVLCGTPNRGVYDWEFNPGNEFNGRAAFLKRLNGGDTDVVPGVAFATLYSEGNDKFAQADGRLVGRAGTPTGITTEGPTLRGATNIPMGPLDHREVAFHPRAFAAMYRFIAGRDGRTDIVLQPQVKLSGLVTGFPKGVQTNRPIAGAKVDVFRVDAQTGARMGDAIYRTATGSDGRYGPVETDPTTALEFVIEAPEHPITHIYRSPFARSSNVVHLRPGRPLADADKAAAAVIIFSRPRGYFGLPRDTIAFDGAEPKDVTPGVPTDSVSTLRLPAGEVGRAVPARFNDEKVVARAWPVAENRITIAELTY
ncbi:alpha/beta hydrolase family protein [Variibacter gotjawalensis]|uniref:Alpha/beta hydrolase family protein n=1 Tax=Variibacter gotjawalensis TaxID=1333996 RepID=A0A0S3PYX7_9BRAD|nr:alpha/beta fold hydrolase [Variibacter gotjawalensis]NIK46972.1 pimeloyl-ACP methyl ester carboxylesterase [Variibacter gotjawalensis]RZS48876.1 lipase (class 2) [Variibacter gotjawalensis]BAT61135.1 alpha/beta hydrolase family protein [Variibacter gotjawalensis]